MREWYRRKTRAERRAWVARRDPETTRAGWRRKHERQKGQVEYEARRRAVTIVNNAIRDGWLERGSCERRGDDCEGRVEAHHDDYSKPLRVRWLCSHHHAVEHYPDAN